MPTHYRTLNFKNTPIHYKTFGNGPAMILLHGFLESSTMWQPLLPQLAEDHFVVAIDLPGHGQSGVLTETHSMELMAEAVYETIQQLQLPSVTVIGHSMGGYVAMALLEKFPECVERLVLLNSTPAADSKERKDNRNRALKVMDQNPRAFISMAISNLFAESSQERFASQIEQLKCEALSFPSEGIKAAIRGMRDRKDRTAILKNFKNEKYAILALEDPLLPVPETEQRLNQAGAKVIKIAGGHMSLVENVISVKEFLRFIG